MRQKDKSKKHTWLTMLQVLAVFAVPSVALAADVGLLDIVSRTNSLLNKSIPVLIGFAVIIFLWGVLQMVLHADNEEKRKEGRKFIFWAIIGIFVMLSVWGLVNFLDATFGLNHNPPEIENPAIPIGEFG